jgi:hypothetical protein
MEQLVFPSADDIRSRHWRLRYFYLLDTVWDELRP